MNTGLEKPLDDLVTEEAKRRLAQLIRERNNITNMFYHIENQISRLNLPSNIRIQMEEELQNED